MYDSLVVKKWAPPPDEIFIDSIPFGKSPPSKKDDYFLCSIAFRVEEIIKLPRRQQIEMFLKVLETIETVAKMQKTAFKECYIIRHNDERGYQVITFFVYLPQKFPYSK